MESFNGFLLSSGDASKCVADNLCACNPLFFWGGVWVKCVVIHMVQSSLNTSELDEDDEKIEEENIN